MAPSGYDFSLSSVLIKRFLLNSELVRLSQTIFFQVLAAESAAESRRRKCSFRVFLRGLGYHSIALRISNIYRYVSFHLGNWKTIEINVINNILQVCLTGIPSLRLLDWSNRATLWTTFDSPFDSRVGSLQLSDRCWFKHLPSENRTRYSTPMQ